MFMSISRGGFFFLWFTLHIRQFLVHGISIGHEPVNLHAFQPMRRIYTGEYLENLDVYPFRKDLLF